MNDWLSATWEANWKPFQYFNLYRLIVAAVLGTMALYSVGEPVLPAERSLFNFFGLVGSLYVFYAGGGLGLSLRWQHHFNLQLSAQVLADVLAATLFMYAAGGLSSGLGVLLLVSLAAASLVGRGRLVLFYAAVATISVLLMHIYGVLTGRFEPATIVQAGMFSAGFFATAILSRLLGQHLMANEELARRRGIALQNQSRISQSIIERMQDGVLVVAPDGSLLRHNPGAETLLGALPAEGGTLAAPSHALADAFAVWRAGQGSDAVEFTGAGGRRVRARFEPTDSSEAEALIFLEDAGRIQERAQQLKLAALGRLTGSIAHEIRNPLAAISHAGDLLREERRADIQERLLRIIGDNVGRLDRIVQDILELGRSDRALPEILRLDQFVEDFVQEFVHTESLDPTIFRIESDGPRTLCFDRSHLRQVLWNLAGNALRHGSRQPGAVVFRVAAAPGTGRVELHVVDDGPGVPEAIAAQIFEPFFTTRHQGTGLGLFIARELCEANGASLELARAAGCGHFILSGSKDTCLTLVPNDAFAES